MELLKLIRPLNSVSPILVYAIGYLLSSQDASTSALIYGVIIIFFMLAYATLQNDIEDFEIDKSNKRKSILLSGELSIKSARTLETTLLFMAFIAAVLSPNPSYSLLFVIIFFLLSYGYNKPPFYFSRKPLLSVVTLGLCYGSAPVLYGLYLSSQQGALLGLVLGCTWLLIKISSVALKDYKDIDGDKKLNKVTFAVKFGKKTTQLLSILCAALGYGFFLALLSISYIHNLAQLLSLLILAIFAIYIVVYRCKFFSKLSRAKAAKIFSNIILLSAVFELGAVLCLLTL